jgi:spermidine synthase
VHVEIGDGFTWARKHTETYDCVFVDLPHPHSYELSRLYSREFYLSVAKLVTPEGFMAFDFPFFALAKQGDATEIRTATSIVNAVRASGFKTVRYFGFWESFLIGFKKDFLPSFDYAALDPLVSDQSVSQFSFIDPVPFSDTRVEANTVFKPHWLRY